MLPQLTFTGTKDGGRSVDALCALKTISETAHQTKVIMVSAMGQKKVMEEFKQAGARDFIIKPFQPGQIKEVVERASNSC